MKSGSYWRPHEIAFANVTIFAASLPRVYCACTTFMEMLWRLAHDHRDPTAFSLRSRSDRRTLAFVLSMLKTNAVTRRSLATMATTARCLAFLPRFYHVYSTLMAILARSGPIFRRRRRAVRTPPRCDGGIMEYAAVFKYTHVLLFFQLSMDIMFKSVKCYWTILMYSFN